MVVHRAQRAETIDGTIDMKLQPEASMKHRTFSFALKKPGFQQRKRKFFNSEIYF